MTRRDDQDAHFMRVAYCQKIVRSLYLLSRGLISFTSKIISFRVITVPGVDELARYIRWGHDFWEGSR
jgi:hypothetical protein